MINVEDVLKENNINIIQSDLKYLIIPIKHLS